MKIRDSCLFCLTGCLLVSGQIIDDASSDIIYTPAGNWVTGEPFDDGWHHDSAVFGLYNGTLSYSNDSLASYSFDFTGTSFQIFAGLGPDRGTFTVAVDGVSDGSGDAYNAVATSTTFSIYNSTVLSNTLHTVTVNNSVGSDPEITVVQQPFIVVDYISLDTSPADTGASLPSAAASSALSASSASSSAPDLASLAAASASASLASESSSLALASESASLALASELASAALASASQAQASISEASASEAAASASLSSVNAALGTMASLVSAQSVSQAQASLSAAQASLSAASASESAVAASQSAFLASLASASSLAAIGNSVSSEAQASLQSQASASLASLASQSSASIASAILASLSSESAAAASSSSSSSSSLSSTSSLSSSSSSSSSSSRSSSSTSSSSRSSSLAPSTSSTSLTSSSSTLGSTLPPQQIASTTVVVVATGNVTKTVTITYTGSTVPVIPGSIIGAGTNGGSNSGGSSSGLAAGLGAGLGGGAALIGAGLLFWFCRRKRRREDDPVYFYSDRHAIDDEPEDVEGQFASTVSPYQGLTGRAEGATYPQYGSISQNGAEMSQTNGSSSGYSSGLAAGAAALGVGAGASTARRTTSGNRVPVPAIDRSGTVRSNATYGTSGSEYPQSSSGRSPTDDGSQETDLHAGRLPPAYYANQAATSSSATEPNIEPRRPPNAAKGHLA